MPSSRAHTALWPPRPQSGPASWHDYAACQDADVAMFFPPKGATTEAAKAICARCPVRAECLEHALSKPELYGVWGGLSEKERQKLRPGRKPVPSVPLTAADPRVVEAMPRARQIRAAFTEANGKDISRRALGRELRIADAITMQVLRCLRAEDNAA